MGPLSGVQKASASVPGVFDAPAIICDTSGVGTVDWYPSAVVTIRVETLIRADHGRCFDLARSLTEHVASAAKTGERVISHHASDLLELGDIVTFEATHFGVRQRLTGRIVEFDRPSRFVDEMVKGAFRSLRHEHLFERVDEDTTRMVDLMTFESPFGILGRLADRVMLKSYLERFLRSRAEYLKLTAEANQPD